MTAPTRGELRRALNDAHLARRDADELRALAAVREDWDACAEYNLHFHLADAAARLFREQLQLGGVR